MDLAIADAEWGGPSLGANSEILWCAPGHSWASHRHSDDPKILSCNGSTLTDRPEGGTAPLHGELDRPTLRIAKARRIANSYAPLRIRLITNILQRSAAANIVPTQRTTPRSCPNPRKW